MKFKLAITLVTITQVFLSANSMANVYCEGKIKSIYKWDTFDTISIMVDGTNRWISMPTKSDESMALMAFAANKTVKIRWEDSTVTQCTDGWEHNKKLKGWWEILKD